MVVGKRHCNGGIMTRTVGTGIVMQQATRAGERNWHCNVVKDEGGTGITMPLAMRMEWSLANDIAMAGS